MTKKDLQRYVPLAREIENRLETIQRMRSAEEYKGIAESDGSRHTNNATDSLAQAIEKRIEYEQTVIDLIRENCTKMGRIESAVNQLDDPLLREVIRLRYMDTSLYRLPTWSEIAEKMYGESNDANIRQCLRLQQNALHALASIRIDFD